MIRIQVIGWLRIEQRLRTMMINGDFRRPLTESGRELRQATAQEFATGGHGTWQPSVRAFQTGKPTLVDTQALHDALVAGGTVSRQSAYYLSNGQHGDGFTPTAMGETHKARGIFRVTTRTLTYGVASSYGRQTQEGGMSARYGSYIVPRRFLSIRDQTRKLITASWLRWGGWNFRGGP